jgi:hypothetical protein
VGKFTAAFHHSFPKGASVFVTLHPLKDTLPIVKLIFELTFVGGTISIHGKAVTLP